MPILTTPARSQNTPDNAPKVKGVATAMVVASMLVMIVIGIFIAAEPRLYDRGIAWMLPLRHRERFYATAERVGWTLRRLLFGRLIAMVFEGVGTWFMLAYVIQLFGIAPVPMAALLGLITGLLAFLPNIGAITSGLIMVAGVGGLVAASAAGASPVTGWRPRSSGSTRPKATSTLCRADWPISAPGPMSPSGKTGLQTKAIGAMRRAL